MSSLAEHQRTLDSEIFAEIGEVLLTGSVEVPGIYNNRPREIQMTDGTFVGLNISFDTQMSPTVAKLERGALVKIFADDDDGVRRQLAQHTFQRRVPDQGDETGLVIIELGTA